jgi:hypothetical protein
MQLLYVRITSHVQAAVSYATLQPAEERLGTGNDIGT